MGKKFAPTYANIYMASWERTLFAKCHLTPFLYYRYLDDIFGIWQHGREEFEHFIEMVNTHHKNITVKYSTNDNAITFLDTTVFRGDSLQNSSTLKIKVYFKDTDTHSLLHKLSFHPRHTFKGIIKSQLIRFHRICTEKEDFQEATGILFYALRNRGYSRRFLRHIKSTTINYIKTSAPEARLLDPLHVIPLITTYSSQSQYINREIKRLFKDIQYGYRDCRNTESYRLIVKIKI